MEFFVAQFLKKNIDVAFELGNVSSAARLLNRRLPEEIRMFLSLYSLLDVNLPRKISDVINRLIDAGPSDREALNNANNVLINMVGTSGGLKFHHGQFQGKSFSRGLCSTRLNDRLAV
jgi:hypothetical protein